MQTGMSTCSLSFASHNFSLTAASRFSSPLCCSIATCTCHIRHSINEIVIKELERKEVKQQKADAQHKGSGQLSATRNAANLTEDLIQSLSAFYVF